MIKSMKNRGSDSDKLDKCKFKGGNACERKVELGRKDASTEKILIMYEYKNFSAYEPFYWKHYFVRHSQGLGQDKEGSFISSFLWRNL